MSDVVKRLARLPAERRAEFLGLLRDELAEPAGQARLVPRDRSGPLPLSYGQETLWFVDQLAPGLPLYNLPLAFWIRGPLDVPALRRALATVVDRHESLRTALSAGPDGPEQIVVDRVRVELPVQPVAGADAPARRAAATALAEAEARDPIELGAAPLWRSRLLEVDPEEHLFLFTVHHAVFDGWSLAVFGSELAELYRAEHAGDRARSPELPVQYPDYALWQREWLQGEQLDDLVRHWTDRLTDAPVLDLPTDRPRPATISYAGALAQRVVDPAVSAGLTALARDYGVTPFTVFVAAFVALLHRYSGQDDVVIGCSIANRSRPEVEPLIGFFVNVLVLRVDLAGDPTFRELVERAAHVVQDAFGNGDLPFERLVDAVRPVRDPSRSPLFGVALSYQDLQDADGPPLDLAGLEVEQLLPDLGTSRFDMSWNVYARGTGLDLAVEFSTALWDPATMERLLDHLEQLMRSAVANPDQPVSGLQLLPAVERAALVRIGSGPDRPVLTEATPQLFARQVAERPDAVAVVAGTERLTYAELAAQVSRLAHRLVAAGVGRDDLVALCLPRTADLVVGMLAAHTAGAGYLPLDPANPPARLELLIADADPRVVLTTGALASRLPGGEPGRRTVLPLDEISGELAGLPDTAPAVEVGPNDLGYVIYTSGSTGVPKGVEVEHHSLVNFVAAMRDLFELTPDDALLGYASVGFDVSVFEVFGALLTGGRLVLAGDDDRLDPERLSRVLADGGVTVTDLPPSVMALLDPVRFPAHRIAFVGGEAFSGELTTRWSRGRRFFNGYGPTECTVTMIVFECTGSWESSPPIGLPIANHVAHVLDRNLEPVPLGVAGELVIGGLGLARGYRGQPELTAERFVPDPFGTAPDGRLYRTGDLVRRRPDGQIVFLGRIDGQVKIRGQRIELGEVESVLAAHPAVGQAVARPWTDPAGGTSLVAYAAARDGAQLPAPAELRAYLAGLLPPAMVPSYLVELDSLPLTASGKVDLRALPDPDPAAAVGAGPDSQPRTATERTVVEEVLGPVLRLDRVGVHDNFFELGGNSLQAAQLMSRISARFSVEVPLADFFAAPTAASLATAVDRQLAARLSDDDLLDLLETMSEDEVARLLGNR